MPERAKQRKATKKTNPEIYRFIDFFVKTGEKIRGKKPEVTRGKDGQLVTLALKKLPVSKLEMLAVWFLAKKPKLQARIGTMLSSAVLEELQRKMNSSTFWKEVDMLIEQYHPRPQPKTWQPFSYKDINDMKEQIAAVMRTL